MTIQIIPSSLELEVRKQLAFVPTVMYENTIPLQGELGAVGDARFVVDDSYVVIRERQEQIRAARFGKAMASDAMRAECALIGHIRLAKTARCLYCGTPGE